MTRKTRQTVFVLLLGVGGLGLGALVGAAGLPLWAYGYITAPSSSVAPMACTAERPFACARGGPPPDDGSMRRVAGSDRTFTLKQIHADYGPADWYPEDHPAMPDIVARGREANGIRACGLCHYPNGQGKPENGPVAGLSVGYFLQQMADFKSGDRTSADPWKANATEMRAMAQALTDAEVKAAAEYFGAIRFRQWVKVVEMESVPKFTAGINGLFLTVKGTTETEPIGQRLIEVPENVDETNLNRNPHSGFLAYVPMGTLKKGEELVKTGACAVCHGPDLRGIADTPPIAGRQASYLARQLYDMQQGSRNGVAAQLMKGVVANLSEGDILAISAYVASRAP